MNGNPTQWRRKPSAWGIIRVLLVLAGVTVGILALRSENVILGTLCVLVVVICGQVGAETR